MSDKDLKQLFQKKFQQESFPFNPEAWDQAAQMLDDMDRKRALWWRLRWTPVLLLLLGAAGWWLWPTSEQANSGTPMITAGTTAPANAGALPANVPETLPSKRSIAPENQPAEAPASTPQHAGSEPDLPSTRTNGETNEPLADGTTAAPNAAELKTDAESPATPPAIIATATNSASPVSTPETPSQTTDARPSTALAATTTITSTPEDPDLLSQPNDFPAVALSDPQPDRERLSLSPMMALLYGGTEEQPKPSLVSPERPNPLPTPQQRLYVFAGWNGSQQLRPEESTESGLDYGLSAGVGYALRLHPRWYLHTDLAYTMQRGIEAQRTVEVIERGFGLERTRYSLTPQSLHFAELPVYAQYHFGRHAVLIGVQGAYLANVRSQLTLEREQSEQPMEVSRMDEWGHREGFKHFQVSLIGGYQLALTTQLSFQVRMQAGLTELANSGYFDQDLSTRNHQLRLSLRYELFRF